MAWASKLTTVLTRKGRFSPEGRPFLLFGHVELATFFCALGSPARRVMIFRLSLVLLALGIAACMDPQPVRIPQSEVRQPGTPVVHASALAVRVHELVNAERAVRRLRPLRWSPLLARVAEQHSQDMSARSFFDHVTPEGRTPQDRAVDANASCGGRQGRGVLENLAQTWLYRNRSTETDGLMQRVTYDWRTQEEIAEESTTRWVRSLSHRRALLAPSARHQGIGVAIRGDGQVLLTQVIC